MQVWNIYPLIYIIHIDAIVGCIYIYTVYIHACIYLYCVTSMPIQDPSQSEYEMYKSHKSKRWGGFHVVLPQTIFSTCTH